MLSASIPCYGCARLVTFLVTFWVENCAIFDGKIGVNIRKRLVFSGEKESPPLRQILVQTSILAAYGTARSQSLPTQFEKICWPAAGLTVERCGKPLPVEHCGCGRRSLLIVKSQL